MKNEKFSKLQLTQGEELSYAEFISYLVKGDSEKAGITVDEMILQEKIEGDISDQLEEEEIKLSEQEWSYVFSKFRTFSFPARHKDLTDFYKKIKDKVPQQ